MAFDAALLINVGAAALFALVGLAILVAGRRSRRGRLIGGFALAFGVTYVLQNLTSVTEAIQAGDWELPTLLLSSAVAQAVLAVALARDMLRGVARSAAGMFWACLVVVAGLVAAVVVLGVDVAPAAADPLFSAFGLTFSVGAPVTLFILLGATALRFHHLPGDAPERNALAGLALAFGPFAVFLIVGGVLFGYRHLLDAAGIGALILALTVVCLATLVPLATTTATSKGWLALLAFPALLGAGVLALLAGGIDSAQFNSYWGIYGVLRTIGVVFLVDAVVRHDLLGVPLPRFAVRRGIGATAALASLFIVAQVAQNFFAAQYGLLMGGVVAGAVVFAANPLQRAMESKAESRSTSPTPLAVPVARRERTYRNALRLAMRDRKLTAEEEVHLFELAEDLGIGAGRAFQLKRDVEAEKEAA